MVADGKNDRNCLNTRNSRLSIISSIGDKKCQQRLNY
jgi:hypothetical protein